VRAEIVALRRETEKLTKLKEEMGKLETKAPDCWANRSF
jgi:hypothetical protein